jgi:hypothetical protein
MDIPNTDDLILLNRLCWLDKYPNTGLDPILCADLLKLGLVYSTPSGHWFPTPAGRSVAVTSVTNGFRSWMPGQQTTKLKGA